MILLTGNVTLNPIIEDMPIADKDVSREQKRIADKGWEQGTETLLSATICDINKYMFH